MNAIDLPMYCAMGVIACVTTLTEPETTSPPEYCSNQNCESWTWSHNAHSFAVEKKLCFQISYALEGNLVIGSQLLCADTTEFRCGQFSCEWNVPFNVPRSALFKHKYTVCAARPDGYVSANCDDHEWERL